MMNNKEAIKDIYERYKNVDIQKDKFFKKKIRLYNPTIRYVAVILCIVLLSSSITIGNNFFNYHSKSKVGYLDEGLYTAISNNYMQNVSMEYQKSNNIGVKITNVLVDTSKIYLVFDFKFYEPLTENVNKLKMPDLLISDENNNVLYCDDPNTYKNFCKDKKLEYCDYSLITSTYSNQFIEKTQDHMQYLVILEQNTDISNIQKLKIEFSNITLYVNLLLYNEDVAVTKSGHWKLEINLK